MNRGDVVVVPFPFQDKLGEKIRPAVVVQADAENQRLANTILAMITGNLDDAGQPTTVLVDPRTATGPVRAERPFAGQGYNLAPYAGHRLFVRRIMLKVNEAPEALEAAEVLFKCVGPQR